MENLISFIVLFFNNKNVSSHMREHLNAMRSMYFAIPSLMLSKMQQNIHKKLYDFLPKKKSYVYISQIFICLKFLSSISLQIIIFH